MKPKWTLGLWIGVLLSFFLFLGRGDAASLPRMSSQGSAAILALPQVTVVSGTPFTLPLTVSQLPSPLYSLDLVLAYDSDVVTMEQVMAGDLVLNWSIAANLQTTGLVTVALAGAYPVTAGIG